MVKKLLGQCLFIIILLCLRSSLFLPFNVNCKSMNVLCIKNGFVIKKGLPSLCRIFDLSCSHCPQIESSEFIKCKEMVDEYLSSLEIPLPANAVYIFNSASVTKYQPLSPQPNQVARWRRKDQPRRKRNGHRSGSHGEREVDEFYDGFRCLYDGNASEGDCHGVLGNVAMMDQDISSCPPLQPHVG